MDETQRRVDEIRTERSELENHLIDEYAWGKISRREFVRRGTVVGMSIPMLSFIAAACGGDDEDGGEAAPTPTGETEPAAEIQPGGTIRVALIKPTTEPNPLLVQDEGGAGILGATGEFLSFSDDKLELQPRIAESWEPNEDGSAWTFTIRQGVTFHNGAPLTANDVVTTFDKLINPDGGSANAQSALGGVLSPGNIEASGRHDRGLQPRRAERQLPHARQLRELQRDHHPGGPRSRQTGARRSRAPARSSSRASCPTSASRWSRTTPTGASRRSPIGWTSSSTTRKRR